MIHGQLQSSENDEFIYHEIFVHPTLLIHDEYKYITISECFYIMLMKFHILILFLEFSCTKSRPKNVLIMGRGRGSIAREVLKYKNIEKVIMCDI